MTRLTPILWLLCSILAIAPISGCGKSSSYKRTPFPQSLTRYTVVEGDTLFSIAYRAGTSVKYLAQLNHLVKPYTLFPGKILTIRPTSNLFNNTQENQNSFSPSHVPQGLRHSRTTRNRPFIAENPKKNLKISWHWPLTGAVVKNFIQTGRKGIDIVGKLGDTVLAAASGKVVYSGSGLKGYGNLIIIKHDLHFLTAYANNRSLYVKEGQAVRKGQKIAEVGVLSGKKPSLHFEIRFDGKPVNPLSYLPKR